MTCLHDFTRSAYAGGRCEVFRERFDVKTEPFSGYVSPLSYGDFNSMYAWAMLGSMPTEVRPELIGRQIQHEWQKWKDVDDIGFIRCTVRIPLDCYLPPLPFRHAGKLIFPVGTFSGTWTTAELALLPQVGGEILSVERSLWFKGEPLFEKYVAFWYAYRQEVGSDGEFDPAKNAIGKQYLTNLYGKFGQDPKREKLYFFPTDEEFAEHELTPLPNVPPSMGAYSEVTISSPPYVIPHIAAWITSKARARLWSAAHGFIRQGYQLYYCDTDSLVTNAPIQDSKDLGALKLECQVKRARFVAPKLYFIEKVDSTSFVKAKGFTGGFGGKGLTEAEFTGLVDHHAKVKVQRMRKLREGVRSGERFPGMKKVLKGLRSGILDEKRIHLANGNTTPIDATNLQP